MLYQQPIGGPAPIDICNPYSRGLQISIAPSARRDSASGKVLALSANASYAASPQGLALQGSATNSPIDIGVGDGAGRGINAISPAGQDFSAFLHVNVTPDAQQVFVGDDGGTGGTNNILIGVIGSQWYFSITMAGPVNKVIQGGSVSAGWHDIDVEHIVGAGISLWVDGVLIGTTSSSSSRATTAGVALRLMNLGVYTGANYGSRSQMVLAAFWNRARPAAERSAISANPWQLFLDPDEDDEAAMFASAPATPTGTLAATLANATLSANGIILNPGALASTLAGATMVASGSASPTPAGTLASTLADAAMSASGSVTDVGTFAATLGNASMAAAGIVTNSGALAATLAGASMTAAGGVAPNASGSFSSTLDGASMAAYGYNGIPPVLAGAFQRLPKNPRHIQRIP